MPRGYPRSWLRGDLVAGVTVSAYLIPQVMAYAVVAGLPPVAGLWAILPALVIYALLGSSPTLSVGPESTTALMTAVAIGPLAAGHTARYAALAAALAILVGLFALVAWVARLGFVADLLSRPVLIGYLTGVAVIMVAGQLGKITGVPVHGRTFIAEITSFARGVVHAGPAAWWSRCWFWSSFSSFSHGGARYPGRCSPYCSPPWRWRCSGWTGTVSL